MSQRYIRHNLTFGCVYFDIIKEDNFATSNFPFNNYDNVYSTIYITLHVELQITKTSWQDGVNVKQLVHTPRRRFNGRVVVDASWRQTTGVLQPHQVTLGLQWQTESSAVLHVGVQPEPSVVEVRLWHVAHWRNGAAELNASHCQLIDEVWHLTTYRRCHTLRNHIHTHCNHLLHTAAELPNKHTHNTVRCIHVTSYMYPLGKGPAYSGPIRWGLFVAGPLR